MGSGVPQRLLEQAVCERGAVGRQGEKPVRLEPSPVLWDLANHEARKGVAPTMAGGMPQGQGTLQAAGTGQSHLPGAVPVGWRGLRTLAERPLKQSRQHVARRWVQTLMPSRGTSTRPAVPQRRVRKTLDA